MRVEGSIGADITAAIQHDTILKLTTCAATQLQTSQG